jgi:hypothetical protein
MILTLAWYPDRSPSRIYHKPDIMRRRRPGCYRGSSQIAQDTVKSIDHTNPSILDTPATLLFEVRTKPVPSGAERVIELVDVGIEMPAR